MEGINWEYITRYGKTFKHGDLVEACGSIWRIIGGIQYTYPTFSETENVYKVKRIEILKPNPYCSRPSNLGDIALFSSWILDKRGDLHGKVKNENNKDK